MPKSLSRQNQKAKRDAATAAAREAGTPRGKKCPNLPVISVENADCQPQQPEAQLQQEEQSQHEQEPQQEQQPLQKLRSQQLPLHRLPPQQQYQPYVHTPVPSYPDGSWYRRRRLWNGHPNHDFNYRHGNRSISGPIGHEFHPAPYYPVQQQQQANIPGAPIYMGWYLNDRHGNSYANQYANSNPHPHQHAHQYANPYPHPYPYGRAASYHGPSPTFPPIMRPRPPYRYPPHIDANFIEELRYPGYQQSYQPPQYDPSKDEYFQGKPIPEPRIKPSYLGRQKEKDREVMRLFNHHDQSTNKLRAEAPEFFPNEWDDALPFEEEEENNETTDDESYIVEAYPKPRAGHQRKRSATI